MNEINDHLDGRILIAMPGMTDPRFEKSVIYMCAHSDGGALGLIVNKPVEDLKFDDLLEQLDLPKGAGANSIRVHFGGPVEHGRGFVLHSGDYVADESTMEVNDEFGMTASLDILQDISMGKGPEQSLLALGYAGWGPGQLESELQRNGWLVAEGSRDIVFSDDHSGKWDEALASLGVSAALLSAEGGSA